MIEIDADFYFCSFALTFKSVFLCFFLVSLLYKYLTKLDLFLKINVSLLYHFFVILFYSRNLYGFFCLNRDQVHDCVLPSSQIPLKYFLVHVF